MSFILIFPRRCATIQFMQNEAELTAAIELLGQVLARRRQTYDLAVIGGGALLLQGLITRATLDLDAVALIDPVDRWRISKPLPEALVTAVREVAEALDLPRQPHDEKDWLNDGPGMLLRLGLPPGFETRAKKVIHGGLTLRIASRVDLIFLKLWAATDTARGSRRAVDIDDLQKLAPSRAELRQALEWCSRKDGRSGFLKQDAGPVVEKLGLAVSEVMTDEPAS
jgi:hypothetical protein